MKSEKKSSVVNRSGLKLTCITILTAGLLLAFLTPVFGQEGLTIKGEAKSGILWTQAQDTGKDPVPEVRLGSKDDAGSGQGRFQLDLAYDNGNGFGMKSRIRWETWAGQDWPKWQYAFGYGNFFNNQLTVSVGKLGSSPYGSGGPEMWKELEISTQGGGIRLEIKPAIVPGLNVGFVLNSFNQVLDGGFKDKDVTFWALLQESILGISYTHDLFHVRFAYRFDSEMDCDRGNKSDGTGEDELLYRIEEYALNKLVLPGLKVWALGYFQGVSSDDPSYALLKNWFFVEYGPPEISGLTNPFTAQVRFGYDWSPERDVFYVKPSFYWHFFNKLISVGAAFTYSQDSGVGKKFPGSPYEYIELEPKIQLNFASSYIAFAYNWRREYLNGGYLIPMGITDDPIRQTQWINLRFCVYY